GASVVVAGLSLRTTSGPESGPEYEWPLELSAVSVSGVPLGGAVWTRTPGKVGVGSFAATEIAPSAVAGEPVMYWFGPLLPAEATTTMPSFAAFVDATADGSSFDPNGEPSDMLTTSMSFATAHSSASTTTSVE